MLPSVIPVVRLCLLHPLLLISNWSVHTQGSCLCSVVVILFNIPDNTRVALYIILKISLKVNIPYNTRVACLFHSIGCSTPLMRKELKVGEKSVR